MVGTNLAHCAHDYLDFSLLFFFITVGRFSFPWTHNVHVAPSAVYAYAHDSPAPFSSPLKARIATDMYDAGSKLISALYRGSAAVHAFSISKQKFLE